jgi:hypothetical protein
VSAAGALEPALARWSLPEKFKKSSRTADQDEVATVTEAISRLNADGQQPVLEAFANSAPYWMTISGCPQGNGFTVGGAPVGLNNLDSTQLVPYGGFVTFPRPTRRS